jgi:hypothetical protein
LGDDLAEFVEGQWPGAALGGAKGAGGAAHHSSDEWAARRGSVSADDVEGERDSGESAADRGDGELVADEGGDVVGDVVVVGVERFVEAGGGVAPGGEQPPIVLVGGNRGGCPRLSGEVADGVGGSGPSVAEFAGGLDRQRRGCGVVLHARLKI